MNRLGHLLSRLLPALALGTLVSCGGGGGGNGDTPQPNAPTISQLSFSPQAAYVSSMPLDFSGQFEFADVDGNLATATLTITDAAGATVSTETLTIGDVAGSTRGTIQGRVTAMVPQAGAYTLRIFVTDAAGLRSNVLTGAVRIADFPWVRKTAGPTAREHAAVAALNGRLYVLGGQRTDTGTIPGPATNAVEIYDPASDRWTSGPPLPTARMGLVAAVLNGKLYAIGGRTDGFSTSAVGTVEVFDPATQAWTTRNPMSQPRHFAAGAALGGTILVAGGERETNVLNAVEAYDPLTNAWSLRATLPVARSQLGAAVADGRLHAIGGHAGVQAQWVGTVEAFDPATGLWSARAPMPTARAHAAVAQAGGLLWVAGGENVARSLDQLESFDPLANAWRTRTPSPVPFTRAAADVVNNKLYIFGNGLTLAYDPANEIR